MNEGGVYDYDEIWPGFHANAASYSLGASDPMLTDQRSNRRKRREEEDEPCAEGGGGAASTTTSNGGGTCSYNNNNNNDLDGKRLKGTVESNINEVGKTEEKTDEPSKQDYIHVRARRGQATDSHSLAERARREKIGERMKTLQDIVPGCNKVIGKALVLDEIINYVQSLQRQVEFLSMKLETVNAGDGYSSKVNFAQESFEAPGIAFGSSQSTDEYSRGSSLKWLHMQIGGEF